MRAVCFFVLFLCLVSKQVAACPQGKAAACASCGGSLSASACICSCGLSAPERLVYGLVLLPALLMFLLYV